MTISTDSKYYTTTILPQRILEQVLFSSPLLAYAGDLDVNFPNRLSGKDEFLVEYPVLHKANAKVDDQYYIDNDENLNTVQQNTMRVSFKRVSAQGVINGDDVTFLFNSDRFPTKISNNLRTLDSSANRVYNQTLTGFIKEINNYQFKVISARGFIYAGDTDVKSWDNIEAYTQRLLLNMVNVNGGVLSEGRLKGVMPLDACSIFRSKSGLNFTQETKPNTTISDTKTIFDKLQYDTVEIYNGTSTMKFVAGKASEETADTLTVGTVSDPTEDGTMTVTFTGGTAATGYFKKGDIIKIKDLTWLVRDQVNVDSGVPVALTVMKDSNSLTVEVSPGVIFGVDLADKSDLVGKKANVVPNHTKGFMWWQPASFFMMKATPEPSTSEYLYRKISGANAAFGAVKNLAIASLIKTYVNKTQEERMRLQAHMYSDYFPFYVGTLILPYNSPTVDQYIKLVRTKTA